MAVKISVPGFLDSSTDVLSGTKRVHWLPDVKYVSAPVPHLIEAEILTKFYFGRPFWKMAANFL